MKGPKLICWLRLKLHTWKLARICENQPYWGRATYEYVCDACLSKKEVETSMLAYNYDAKRKE